ncbi:MAG: glycosyltransferase family 2 protein [Planctomycetaceae bacterium]|nr:glycosyltransferase family 2 protein [Planctomycetaceae bacterium]
MSTDGQFGLVSTIIPVFNRPAMLREAVGSVLRQTYRPIEIIIIDDGSTDETPRVASALAIEHSGVIQVLTQSNSGPGAARNLGLQAARGAYIQYLDSDDLLQPQKFELQVAALHAQEEAGVCYCITLRHNPKTGAMEPWARTAEDVKCIFPEFLMKRGWATLTPLWRRSVCERIGPWGDFRVMEDWEHDLRAGLLGVTAVHVPEPLAIVRDHGGDRASGMLTGFTPALTRDFFRTHRSIWARMRTAGAQDWSYLEGFSRKMFWIARMCGERGLIEEADEALAIAREMVNKNGDSREIRLFGRLVRIVGWRNAVRWSEAGQRMIRRLRGVSAG